MTTAPGWDEETTGPVYANVTAFVEDFLIPTFPRPRSTRWCAAWWKHPEAVFTFKALWASWEHTQARPELMIDWLLRQCHPAMDRLTGDQSPFIGCTAGNGIGERAPEHAEGQWSHPNAYPDYPGGRKWFPPESYPLPYSPAPTDL